VKLTRFYRSHPRTLLAVAAGAIAYLLLPGPLRPAIRFILAWDLGIVLFLVLVTVMVLRATPALIRTRGLEEDETAWIILVAVAGAALASLAAIGAVLHDAKDLHGWAATRDVALAGGTILLSWLMTHTIFALHYAHAFYGDFDDPDGDPETPAGGLAFPEEKEPGYWDFLYFSFVVGMTCQVSDVQVTSRRLRRVTLGHGVLAFLYNTVILALSINIVAGLM
jgi:uncharacterized membrane protein